MNMMNEMISAQSERSLEDYLDMAIRQRWVILAITLVVFVAGMLWSLSKDPIYYSAMTVQFQSEDTAMSNAASMQMGRGYPGFQQQGQLDSKIAVIKSLPVAVRIVKELKLDRVTTLVAGRSLWMKVRDRIKNVVGMDVPLTHVDLGEFMPPADKAYDSLLVTFLGEGHFRIENPLTGHALDTVQGREVELDGFKLSISSWYGPVGTVYSIGNRPAEPIAKGIRARLNASQSSSDMLYVTYTDYDRFRVAAVLRALASVYGDEEVAFKGGRLQKKIDFLDKIQQRVQSDLNELHANTNSSNLMQDMQGEVLLGQVEGLSKRWAEAYGEIRQTRFILDYLAGISDNKLEAAMQVLDVPESMSAAFSELSSKISKLQAKRTLLRRGVTDKFPEVVKLDREIDILKGQVKELRKRVNSSLEQKIAFLKQRMDQELRETKREQKAGNAEALRRALERKGQSTALTALLQRVLESKQQDSIDQAILLSDVRVIEPAEVPFRPILPNRFNDAVKALLAALALALGVAFLRENMDRTIKSLAELESKSGLAVFGTLPFSASEAGNRNSLITMSKPRSPESEAYRSLRTNIQFANLEKTIKTLIMTSAVPGEGKTTTTCNIAVTMANSGLKTLLIDCDMRKPRVNEYFGLERHSGLSDILIHSRDWHEVAMPTTVENLSVISSGSIPPNPSELLGSKSMSAFLEEIKEEYEMILLDVPPVLVVTDAVLLGPKVDGLFLVVRANHAPIDAVQRAITQLNTVHIKPVGVIFNGFKVSSVYGGYGYKKYGRYGGKYGGYGGYGSKYGYYSHDYGEDAEKKDES
ncbi:polysaccharide biosynthesis tyrosine autokinase [Mariprofundus ferrooxydans]|uniref:polysaccharide biosynthesis tyrosine autokinase n=1 Tax=Mariprofundus ferrooxydans TaxID=314344 RepID=UPI0014304057|nr:polysaccharide biosynthesis tyrosine autokinase [Mariprofundus ferrooxydans]